ncbi:MAG: hypothetical protein FNP40_06020 [Dehalobacter sp. 4CP]|nr:hypothetical protein [Dehalobacter sp. 4CP]
MPNYMTLAEYLERQEQILASITVSDPQLDYEKSQEGKARYRETVTAVWELPPQYTDEEHDAILEEMCRRRGPYRKGGL